ncbi:unnamed protein product [Cuscuta epithymum]|uniref:Uncharacterized protein n=1 Tax=Cuscuta epithymum TaxID=186058 RepID=A0AAV0GFY8_9ASTE|nr:unnamed protein product [Cuscuta epithymum]
MKSIGGDEIHFRSSLAIVLSYVVIESHQFTQIRKKGILISPSRLPNGIYKIYWKPVSKGCWESMVQNDSLPSLQALPFGPRFLSKSSFIRPTSPVGVVIELN